MIYIYHDNDMDGRVSAAVLYEYLNYSSPNEVIFIEVKHGFCFDFSSMTDHDTVYILDYSVGTQNILSVCNALYKGCKIIWIDHHKKSKIIYTIISLISLRHSSGLSAFINTDHCASWLVYEWCVKRISTKSLDSIEYSHKALSAFPPKIIQYVEAWDLWKKNLVPDWKQFHYGVDPLTYKPDKLFGHFLEDRKLIFTPEVSVYSDAEEMFIRERIEVGRKMKQTV